MAPGWKKVVIKPHLNYRIKNINFSYDSISGKYEISWKWIDNKFNINVSIPYGTQAEIILPNGISHNVSAGKYNYECKLNKEIYSPFSIETPIIDIMKDEKGFSIIKKFLPKIYSNLIQKNNYKKHSIKSANLLSNINYPKNIIERVKKKLSEIKP